jgi:gamma-glutamyltranspeptidase/glutathione hydrolase
MTRNGDLMVNKNTPETIRVELRKKGYKLSFEERSSGPINAIFFDWKHGSMWGGSSNHGEDYGIGW